MSFVRDRSPFVRKEGGKAFRVEDGPMRNQVTTSNTSMGHRNDLSTNRRTVPQRLRAVPLRLSSTTVSSPQTQNRSDKVIHRNTNALLSAEIFYAAETDADRGLCHCACGGAQARNLFLSTDSDILVSWSWGCGVVKAKGFELIIVMVRQRRHFGQLCLRRCGRT